jgi:hypothetical protein
MSTWLLRQISFLFRSADMRSPRRVAFSPIFPREEDSFEFQLGAAASCAPDHAGTSSTNFAADRAIPQFQNRVRLVRALATCLFIPLILE